ncbi:MAG: ABC transporter permease subunit, partial [Pararhodobacter sp.]
GLAAMFGKPFEGVKAPSMPVGPLRINWIVWLGLAMVPLVWWFLNRSRAGLILRGVGENHDAAHALGYNVRLTRVAAIAFGGAMAGVGGAFIS